MNRLVSLTLLSLCLCVSVASAQDLWPGAKYDAAIPTLQQVVGHDTGLEITSPDQVGDYLQAIPVARNWKNTGESTSFTIGLGENARGFKKLLQDFRWAKKLVGQAADQFQAADSGEGDQRPGIHDDRFSHAA